MRKSSFFSMWFLIVALLLPLAGCGDQAGAATTPTSTSVSDLITKGPWVDVRAFKRTAGGYDLTAANAYAVSSGRALLITAQCDYVPSTLTAAIKVMPGGKINNSSALAISGPFEGAEGCFIGAGAVTGLEKAMPDFWKVNTTPGTTDMASAIRAANTAAALKGKVYFSGLAYAVKSELFIKAPWVGQAGKTRLLLTSDFAYSTTYSFDPQRYSMIWNSGINYNAYNASTADYISVEGIEFVKQTNSSTFTQIMTLSNVKGGAIRHCKFSTEGITVATTNLDLHSSVKNLVVENNEFYNETTASSGGCIWVRNLTFDTANPASATENITIRKNKFVKNSGDEVVAVYGVFSLTRKVLVEDNDITQSGVAQGTLMMATALASAGYTATAEVKNVQFVGNHINTTATTNDVLRAGLTGEDPTKCSDILFKDNVIVYDAPATGTRAAIRKISGTNIKAINNQIYNVGTTNAVQYGIYSLEFAEGNTLMDMPTATAYMAVAIQGTAGGRTLNNTIITKGVGLKDVPYAELNTVKAALPWQVISNGQYDAFNNHFEITTTGLSTQGAYYNSLGGSVNPSGRLVGNTIVCNDSTNHRSVLLQGTGRFEMAHNRITGSGKYVYGKLAAATADDWFGVRYSDALTSSAIDGDLLYSLPVGQFLKNIGTQTVDTNGNLLAGWVKLTSGSLQAVYSRSTSTATTTTYNGAQMSLGTRAAGECTSWDEAVSGAVLGDGVIIAPDTTLDSGVVVSGKVKSADLVTVSVCNFSGGSYAFPNLVTYRKKLIK